MDPNFDPYFLLTCPSFDEELIRLNPDPSIIERGIAIMDRKKSRKEKVITTEIQELY